MSDPADLDDRINAAVDKAEDGARIYHEIANGPVGTYVQTESGPIPSVAEWQQQHADELGNLTVINERIDQTESRLDGVEADLDNPGVFAFNAFATGISRSLAARFSEEFNLAEFADLSVVGGLNTAVVKAQLAMTRPSVMVMPQGFFTINSTILLRTDIPIRFKGAGIYSTAIGVTSAMTGLPMIKSDASVVDNHHVEGMTLLGGGFAAFGYQCENLIHGSITNVMVQGSTVAAIRTNNGYNVYFEKLQLLSNLGNGLDITGSNNNNVNLNDCNIYANNGVGVRLSDGWGVTLNGCSIEGNKVAGLMCWSLRGLKVNGGYMERNAEIGYAYTTADGSPQNLTVKADIHLLSGARTIGITEGLSVMGAVIDGVSFTPFGSGNVPTAGLSQDCIVFCTDMDNLRITNNDILDTAHVTAMVGIFDDNRRSRCKSLRLEQNTLNNIMRLGTAANDFTFNSAHNIENGFETLAFQYASQTIGSYAVADGATGALTAHTSRYGTVTAWQMSTGDRLYGYSLDITANPELRGRHIWFGLAYRVQEASTGLQIFCGGRTENAGAGTESVTPAGVWKFKSVLRYVDPSDTTIFVGFKRIGAGTQPLLVAAPSIGVVGVSLAKLNSKRA